MFSVRLVTADFYMSTPIRTLDVGYSDFRGAEVKQIPVIRVFGSTLTGRKVCLHIHGVFPYIYIPYDGAEPYERLVYQVASALDKALNISQGSATSNTQHVYKIILVSGIPFYGYHAREHQFLKIYLYNPLMVKKTVELLQNGAILNKVFQPHEAHLTFILQFMIDYNLFGMSPVNLSAVKFRRSSETQGHSQEDIPEDLLLPEKVTRISSCDLEVDALATDILNRNTITGVASWFVVGVGTFSLMLKEHLNDGFLGALSIGGELSVNPGLAGIWEDEKQRRRVEGRVSQITPQQSQERPFSHSTRSELCFKQLLKEKLRNQNSQDVNEGSAPQDVSYPAETPHDIEMIGASFLEPHVTPVSRVPVAPSTNEDDSVVNVELVLSLSSCGPRTPGLMQTGSQQLNSQDMQLMKDLDELHDHSVSVDDDSILGSQRTTCDAWQNGNEEEEENNLEDLSQPLEEPSGDMKDFSAIGDFSEKLKSDMDDDINDGLWEESFWNDIATHIPQLDGADDIPTKPRQKGFLRKDKGSTVRSRIPLKRPPSSLSMDDGLSNSSTRSQNEDSNELLARSCTSEQVSTRKATHLGCIEECSVMNSPISECGDNYLGSGANIRISDYSYIANVDSNICVSDKKVSVGEDAFNAVNTDRESPYPTCTNLSDEAQTSIITLSDNEIEYLDTPVSDAPVIVISDEEDDFNSDASDSDNVVITLSDSEKEYVDNPPSDCGNTSFFGFVDTPVSECRTTPISDNMDFNIGAPETSSQASDVAWLLKDIVKEKCLEEEIFKDDFNSYFSHNNIDPKSPCPLLSESAEAIEASNTALIEAQNVSDLERYNTFNTFNLNGDNFDNVLIGDPKLSSMLSFSEKDDSLVETENNLSEICLGGQPMLSDAPELDVVMQAFSDLGSNEYNDILSDPRLSTCLDNNLGNDQTLSMSSFDVIKTPETSITEIKSQSINLRQRAPKKSQSQRKPNVPKVDNLLNNVDTSTAVQNLLNNVDTSTAVQTTSVAKQFEKNKPTYPKQGRHGKTAITSKVASDALTALDSRSIGSVVPLNTQGLQNESEQTNNKVVVVLPLRTFEELSCAVDQGSGLNGEATSDITKQTKIVYPAQRLVSRKAPKRKQTSEPVLEQMLVNKSTNTDRFTGLLNCNVLNGVSFTAVKAHKSSGKQDIIESQNLNKTPQQPSTSVPKRRGRPRKSQNLANIASTNNSFGTPISVVSNNNFTFYEISKWIAIPNANVVKTNTQTPQNEPTNNYDPYEFCEDADDCVNKNQSYRGLRFPSTSFEPKSTVENYTKTLKPEMVITSTSKINEQSNRKSLSSKASNMMIIDEKSKHGNLPLTPKKIQAILMPKSVPDFVPVKPMNVPRGYYSTCMESNAPQVDGKQGECFENKTSLGSSSLDFGKSTVTGNNNVRATKKAVIPKVTLKRYVDSCKNVIGPLTKKRSLSSQCSSKQYLSSSKSHCVSNVSARKDSSRDSLGYSSPEYIPDTPPPATKEYHEDLEEPNGADIRNVNIEETGDHDLSTHKDNTKISQPSHMDLYLQPSTLLSDKSVENKQDVFNSMDSLSLEKLKSLQRLSQDVLVNVQDNLPSSNLDADDENEDDEGIISFYVATQNSDLLESDYSLSDSCIEDDLGEEKITPFDGLDVNLRQDEDSDGIVSVYETTLMSPSDCELDYDSTKSVCDTENLVSLTPNTDKQESITPIVEANENNFKTVENNEGESSRINNSVSHLESNTERDNLPSFTTPKFKFQEPFYSNSSDVTGPVDVGNKILHIKYKMVTDVHIYENGLCNENINNNRSARSNAVSLPQDPVQLKIMKSASSNQTEITVPPPSVDELWEKANNMLKRKQLSDNLIKERKQKITRIHMPSSPGANDVFDYELSLSPCSQATDAGSSPFNENALVLIAHSTPMQQCPSSTGHKPRFSKYKSWKEKMSRRRKSSSLTPPNCHKPSDGDVSLPSVCEEATVEEEQSTGQDDQHKSMGNPSVLMSAVSGQLTSSTSTQILSQNSTLLKDVLSDEFLSQSATPLGPKRRPSSGYQITGCTPNNTHAFRMSFENLQEGRAVTEHQYLTLLSLELHVKTRGDLRPDPDYDPIRALFYCVVNDVPEHSGLPQRETGVFAVHDTTSVGQSSVLPPLARTGVSCQVEYVKDESALITSIQQLVIKWDPDILAGYEVEMQSWGYLFQRAFSLGVNLVPLVSRVPLAVRDSFMTDSQEGGEMKVAGRVVLNVWRLMRNEVSLTSYTFENVMYHVLHQRVALHSFKSLSQWWEQPTPLYRWITVEHYLTRVDGLVNLLGQLDLIARTSELARLFGIQFYEVFSRGSQFRVESMMLRLAKPMNFVPVTPSIRQRAKMRAPEHIQLIMEPESRMFVDPVIVLDFQSLYPSIIIGYNYCFSTCLGRVEHLGKHGVFEFGCTQLKVPLSQQLQLEENLNISPCGVAFVDAGVRQGILPRMLQEILETRLMVKKSMKEHKDNKILQRILHARQLGLKLIANVTYGYTAANFSGRMPCVEVGDSVVSKGRETLERAIDMVENTPRWNAHVVYGDTDSLFVLVKGRNRQQAFKIGAEIAEAVTRDNPKPVKLKLEKVYQPCILQTKKRYVGYMYEHPEQKTPTYDAKGIETVRRDGCPVVAKMLEKCLKLLFETRDVSLVKRYVCRQFDKLLQGRTNIQDLMFAKEYRGMAGYKAGACVPALELTRRWLQTDKRAEPRVRERVPYVVVNGPPGVPLIRLVRSPHELLENPSLRVNVTYYITRVIIPPLNRCFSLIGADVDKW
uniref:DNA polymerase zeta catalytic subunit n=1 Tax=Timema monikensis TaxID=170555 RepID=A0A7R9E2M7_9NEOP|nr:unnamed protein product [Timema monikensis]